MSGSESNIVELRQYTLHPGKRDLLIDLFEREFIETQEALGMEIIGTFRDADNPDRFVWLRGFPDMESRAKSLAAFYGGPVWKAHREAANATMLDSDNVLLLRPAWDGSGFPSGGTRTPVGTRHPSKGMIAATIAYFDEPLTDRIVHAFRKSVPGVFSSATDALFGVFVSEPSPNTFPALPVREGENALVWFSLFDGLERAPDVRLLAEPERLFAKSAERLRLLPTARSRLHA